MKGVLFTFIISLHLIKSFVVIEKPPDELISVAVFFRHGDRSPTKSFPNDKYFDLRYWPMGFGQLTEYGIDRQYKLGQWFRSRYNSFLSEEYSPNDIHVYSTDVDRTLMSAAANLAGFYPPKNDQIWNQNLLWRPIPIHTSPRIKDDIITRKRNCPKYDKHYEKVKESDFFKAINKNYSDFYNLVSEYTGWKVKNIGEIRTLRSVLYCYKNYNVSFIPEWAPTLDQSVLDYLSGLAYQRNSYTKKLKRLGIGPFFDYLFSHFDNVTTNVSSTRFLMMSGHDTSLTSILNAMGVFDLQPINFAEVVIWELKRKVDTKSFYINLYQRKSEDDLVQLRIEGCEFDCGYEDFKRIMKPISINIHDWEKECFE
nr:lysosomal acid phosphatase-like isoform X2 [Leptinotarsa decemlineata]